MRKLLSLLVFLLLCLQAAVPQAATEAAMTHASAVGVSTKLPKIYTDLPATTRGRVTQPVKASSTSTTASHRKLVPSQTATPAASSTKKPASTGTRAQGASLAKPHSPGEGPRIVSILGGEQQ